jgi:hypothetical protein
LELAWGVHHFFTRKVVAMVRHYPEVIVDPRYLNRSVSITSRAQQPLNRQARHAALRFLV